MGWTRCPHRHLPPRLLLRRLSPARSAWWNSRRRLGQTHLGQARVHAGVAQGGVARRVRGLDRRPSRGAGKDRLHREIHGDPVHDELRAHRSKRLHPRHECGARRARTQEMDREPRKDLAESASIRLDRELAPDSRLHPLFGLRRGVRHLYVHPAGRDPRAAHDLGIDRRHLLPLPPVRTGRRDQEGKSRTHRTRSGRGEG